MGAVVLAKATPAAPLATAAQQVAGVATRLTTAVLDASRATASATDAVDLTDEGQQLFGLSSSAVCY
jgi:hypothetical protein